MKVRVVRMSWMLAGVLLAGAAVPAAQVRFVTDAVPQVAGTSLVAVDSGVALDADSGPPAVPSDGITAGLDAAVMGDFACPSDCDDCGGCGHCALCLPTSRLAHGPLCLPWLNRFLGCDADWDPALRRWSVSAGAMLLTSPQLGNHVLATDKFGPVLNAQDTGLGFAGGPVVSFLWYGTYFDMEARYFAVDRWSGHADFKYATPEEVTASGASTYASALRSFELNLRRNHTEWLTWLTGFRTVQVDDDWGLAHSREDLQVVRAYATTTRNRLYGWQVGADAILWEHNRLRVEGVAKGGVFGNDRQLTAVGLDLKTGSRQPKIYSDTQLGFLGEIGLTAAYRLNPCWTLRGGYQLFWVDGLATAAGQGHTVYLNGALDGNLPTGLTGSETNFYHGAMVALEYTWSCRRGS